MALALLATNIVLLFFMFCVQKLLLASPVAKRRSLAESLKAHSLATIDESSPEYVSATQDFNLRVTWRPLALVVPRTAQEVSLAVQCANAYDVKVAARGGGHSYAGNGLGGADGSLAIDMKEFRTLHVDADTKIATIGAGNRLGDVATALYEQGRRALPHGNCPG